MNSIVKLHKLETKNNFLFLKYEMREIANLLNLSAPYLSNLLKKLGTSSKVEKEAEFVKYVYSKIESDDSIEKICLDLKITKITFKRWLNRYLNLSIDEFLKLQKEHKC